MTKKNEQKHIVLHIFRNLITSALQWHIALDSIMVLKFRFFCHSTNPPILINWWKFAKLQTYCIICFQKPQNTSFPMVYDTWFYDNFEILIFFNPPHKLAKINKNKNILYNMFSETSEYQLPNGISHLILWRFWNFDFFFTPAAIPPLINWQKFTKMKTYCITCFQKPQNTSFPMVYHTWFYDNFDFFVLPTPSS